jgi:hypothetical protein
MKMFNPVIQIRRLSMSMGDERISMTNLAGHGFLIETEFERRGSCQEENEQRKKREIVATFRAPHRDASGWVADHSLDFHE